MNPDELNLSSELHIIMNNRLIDYVHLYVKTYPDRDAAAALIFVLMGDNKEIETAASALTDRARNSVVANLYKKINTGVSYRYDDSSCD